MIMEVSGHHAAVATAPPSSSAAPHSGSSAAQPPELSQTSKASSAESKQQQQPPPPQQQTKKAQAPVGRMSAQTVNSHAFGSERFPQGRTVDGTATDDRFARMKLQRQKSQATMRREASAANFAKVARSGLMVTSARRLGRSWVNKMYNQQMEQDEGAFQRVLGDGVTRDQVTDPKMLFEFEKYLDQEKVPYHAQGNHTFYLEKVVKKREGVAHDPLVQRCLTRLWHVVPKNGADGRHIARQDFVNFHLCLQRVLFDPFVFPEALRRAEDDWAVDVLRPENSYSVMPTLSGAKPVGGSDKYRDPEVMAERGMSEGQFRGSMFEFADVWTDSVERMDYVRFLSVVLDRISLKRRLSEWEYYDKFAVSAPDEEYRGRDEMGRDQRKWLKFRPEVSRALEEAFLAERETCPIDFRGQERHVAFLLEEVEGGVGLTAVPVRRLEHDDFEGTQPQQKNELSLATAVRVTSKMRLRARAAVRKVQDIKPLRQVAERSGNCNAPAWLRGKIDLRGDKAAELGLRSLEGGFYPLHVFTARGDLDMVEYLLARGDDPYGIGPDGMLLMHLAAGLGFVGIVSTLLRYPVDPHRQNLDGDTALHCAAKEGRTECVRLLLQQRPRLTRNGEGHLPGDAGLFVEHVDANTRAAISALVAKYQEDPDDAAFTAPVVDAAPGGGGGDGDGGGGGDDSGGGGGGGGGGEEARESLVQLRREALLRSHGLHPTSLSAAVAEARLMRDGRADPRGPGDDGGGGGGARGGGGGGGGGGGRRRGDFLAAAQIHVLENRARGSVRNQLLADIGNASLAFDLVDDSDATASGGGSFGGDGGGGGTAVAARVHQVLDVPMNCMLTEELERNGLHLTRRLFATPDTAAGGPTGRGGGGGGGGGDDGGSQSLDRIFGSGLSPPAPRLRKFLLDELQSKQGSGLQSAPWLSLLKYHPYFVFEDTSIGGPSLYIVNQRAARAVRRAFVTEDALHLEKTYRTRAAGGALAEGGEGRAEQRLDTIASVAAQMFVDPFELWHANRGRLAGCLVHTPLAPGLDLDLPVRMEVGARRGLADHLLHGFAGSSGGGGGAGDQRPSTAVGVGARYQVTAPERLPAHHRAFVDVEGVRVGGGGGEGGDGDGGGGSSSLSHQDLLRLVHTLGCKPHAVRLDLRTNVWTFVGRSMAMCKYIRHFLQAPAVSPLQLRLWGGQRLPHDHPSQFNDDGRCPYCLHYHRWGAPPPEHQHNHHSGGPQQRREPLPQLHHFLRWHGGQHPSSFEDVCVTLRRRHHRHHRRRDSGASYGSAGGGGGGNGSGSGSGGHRHRRQPSRLHEPTDSSASKQVRSMRRSFSRSSVGSLAGLGGGDSDLDSDEDWSHSGDGGSHGGGGGNAAGGASSSSNSSSALQDHRTVCLTNADHAHVADVLGLLAPIKGASAMAVTLDDQGVWMVLFGTRDEAARVLRKLRVFGGDLDGARVKAHHVQMLSQMRKSVALKKASALAGKPSANAYEAQPTGVFHADAGQLRGLNVVRRELSATSRTVNADNLRPRPPLDMGVGAGAAPSQLALRRRQQEEEERKQQQQQQLLQQQQQQQWQRKRQEALRPSTAPGRLPLWQQEQQQRRRRQRHQETQRARHSSQQQGEREGEQDSGYLPEPRSPTGGGSDHGSGNGRRIGSRSPPDDYHRRHHAQAPSMPRLATPANVDDARAAAIIQAVDRQFPASASRAVAGAAAARAAPSRNRVQSPPPLSLHHNQRPHTASAAGPVAGSGVGAAATRRPHTAQGSQQGADRLRAPAPRTQWLRPATAQARVRAAGQETKTKAAMRTVEPNHRMVFHGIGRGDSGGDRPETDGDGAARRRRRPHTTVGRRTATGGGGGGGIRTNQQHHHQHALPTNGATGNGGDGGDGDDDANEEDDDLSTGAASAAGHRGKRSLGRLFVGSAPLLSMGGYAVNDDAAMRLHVVPQVRHPEVFAPTVLERCGRRAAAASASSSAAAAASAARKGKAKARRDRRHEGGEEQDGDGRDAAVREGLQLTLRTSKMTIR